MAGEAAGASTSIRVSTSFSVNPSSRESWETLTSPFLLGPLDLVPSYIPIAVVYVYARPANSDSELISFERLHLALQRLLNYYPHLSGRIQINPNDHTPEISRLGTGAELVAAQCSSPLSAFHSTSPSPSPSLSLLDLPRAANDLLPSFDSSPEGVCRKPLLTIQHTSFACGGVALGVRVRHCLCDAQGFFQLVEDLAELYRGGGTTSEHEARLAFPPHVQSFMSELSGGKMEEEEARKALSFVPKAKSVAPPPSEPLPTVALDPDVPSTAPPATLSPPSPSPPTTGRVVRFSPSELATIKAQATSLLNKGEWVSTFEALSAHIYQRVHLARLRLRQHTPSSSSKSTNIPSSSSLPLDFLTPTNLREHLSLPPRYFPNALATRTTTLSSLADAPLSEIAKSIHDLLQSPPDVTEETLKWMAAQPDKDRIQDQFRYSEWSFMLSAWSKFDIYGGSRFEVKPILVAPPFTAISNLDGLGYLLPAAPGAEREKGAIELYLALSEPVWALLEENGGFRLEG